MTCGHTPVVGAVAAPPALLPALCVRVSTVTTREDIASVSVD